MTSPPAPPSADDQAGFQEALLSHAAGDFLKAVEFYQSMPEHAADYLEGQHYLGIALHHLGRHEQAITVLEKTVTQSDARIDWLGNFANVLVAQNKLTDAIRIFEKMHRLAPDDVQTLINLGSVYERSQHSETAEQCYQKAIALDPNCQEAYRLLSTLYAQQGRAAESVEAYCRSYILSPIEDTTPFLLGKAYYVLGQLEKAAEVYQRWKEQDPGNPIPVHLHAACSNQNVPDRCSDAYIHVTFDDYAPEFDQKLSQLGYSGPSLLDQLLKDLAPPTQALTILDAGCGTGLCAPMLKPYARILTGVDLSSAMLAYADQRALYDELYCQEIGAYLDAAPHPYDLIVCMDTLIYFGALDPIIGQITRALTPQGLLIFTTEMLTEEIYPFKLQASGRYAHHRSYLDVCFNRHGLKSIHCSEQILRTELDKPVRGYLIAASRSA